MIRPQLFRSRCVIGAHLSYIHFIHVINLLHLHALLEVLDLVDAGVAVSLKVRKCLSCNPIHHIFCGICGSCLSEIFNRRRKFENFSGDGGESRLCNRRSTCQILRFHYSAHPSGCSWSFLIRAHIFGIR